MRTGTYVLLRTESRCYWQILLGTTIWILIVYIYIIVYNIFLINLFDEGWSEFSGVLDSPEQIVCISLRPLESLSPVHKEILLKFKVNLTPLPFVDWNLKNIQTSFLFLWDLFFSLLIYSCILTHACNLQFFLQKLLLLHLKKEVVHDFFIVMVNIRTQKSNYFGTLRAFALDGNIKKS